MSKRRYSLAFCYIMRTSLKYSQSHSELTQKRGQCECLLCLLAFKTKARRTLMLLTACVQVEISALVDFAGKTLFPINSFINRTLIIWVPSPYTTGLTTGVMTMKYKDSKICISATT